MPYNFFLVELIMSIWAVAIGAWVGAIEQPFRFIESLRWAASFGMLTVMLFVANSDVFC